MKKFEDIDLVNYIINEEATLKEAADFFEVSVDTIKKRMASIKGSLITDSRILKELNEVADNNTLAGRKKGGKSPNSGVVRTVDLETIATQAAIILSQNLTIDEASQFLGIPSSTLYEHLELLNTDEYLEIYQDLKTMYECHIQNKTGINIENLKDKYSAKPEEKRK